MKIEKDHTLLKPHNGVKVFVKSHSTFTMFLTTIMIVGIFNLVNKGVSDLEMCILHIQEEVMKKIPTQAA